MFYVLPLLADMLMATLAFIAPVWAVTEGHGVSFTSSLGVVNFTFYVMANLALSRIARPENAHRLLRFGLAGMGIAIGLGALVNDPRWMFLIVVGASVSAACFFTPYQMVMHSGKARPLGQTVALYNVAWMSGYLAGPGIGAPLMHISRRLVHIVAAMWAWIGYELLGYAIAKDRAEGRDHATETFDGADAQVRKRGRDFYIWIGWASIFVQGYAMCTIFYVFPKLGVVREFSGPQLGVIESISALPQILVTFLAMRVRRWLYTPALTVAAAIFGACGFCVMALTRSYAANMGGLLLLGVAGGINCYVSVYYANNHADRSRGISLNEAAVGAGSILGPAVGLLLGGGANPTLTPYWIAAAVFLALGAWAMALHWRWSAATKDDGQ